MGYSSTAPFHSVAKVAIWEIALEQTRMGKWFVDAVRPQMTKSYHCPWLRITAEKNTRRVRTFININYRLGGVLRTSKHHLFNPHKNLVTLILLSPIYS